MDQTHPCAACFSRLSRKRNNQAIIIADPVYGRLQAPINDPAVAGSNYFMTIDELPRMVRPEITIVPVGDIYSQLIWRPRVVAGEITDTWGLRFLSDTNIEKWAPSCCRHTTRRLGATMLQILQGYKRKVWVLSCWRQANPELGGYTIEFLSEMFWVESQVAVDS